MFLQSAKIKMVKLPFSMVAIFYLAIHHNQNDSFEKVGLTRSLECVIGQLHFKDLAIKCEN